MKRALLIFTLLFAVCLFAATKLTNVSLDAEGTGNTITIPVKSWFPAASCQNASPSANWDMLSSSIPSAVCSSGTNVVKGYLQYLLNSQQAAQFTYLYPSDGAASGKMDIKFVWSAAATSATAQFSIDAACTSIGANATDDPVFVSLWAPSAFTSSATANAINLDSTTGLTAPCSAGQLMHIRVKRVDTAGSVTGANVYGIELTYRRSM
jgi:hypothetical protein